MYMYIYLSHRKKQVLTMTGENKNPHMLLMGLKTGTAAVENSLAFPQKFKHRVNIRLNNFTSWYICARELKT